MQCIDLGPVGSPLASEGKKAARRRGHSDRGREGQGRLSHRFARSKMSEYSRKSPHSTPTATSLDDWFQTVAPEAQAWQLLGASNTQFAINTVNNVTVTPFQIPGNWAAVITQRWQSGTLTPADVKIIESLSQQSDVAHASGAASHSSLVLQSLTSAFLDDILPCLPELVRSFLFDYVPTDSAHVAQISMSRPQSRQHLMLHPKTAARFAQRVAAILSANLHGASAPLATLSGKISKELYDAYLLVLLCSAAVLQVAPENPSSVPLLALAVETVRRLKLNHVWGSSEVVHEPLNPIEKDFGYASRLVWHGLIRVLGIAFFGQFSCQVIKTHSYGTRRRCSNRRNAT